jgi:hypothetical protein
MQKSKNALIFKTFFSGTSWSISIKLGTYHLCVKGIQTCSNKFGKILFKDNYKFVVILNFFQQPMGLKSSNSQEKFLT